jgi:DNA-binding CsgD family transcriptional regulator
MTPQQLQQLLSGEKVNALKSDLDMLDERELEVFSILSQGYSNSQIDSQFGIPPKQLKEIKERIQKKLGLKNEVQLLQLAVKRSRS